MTGDFILILALSKNDVTIPFTQPYIPHIPQIIYLNYFYKNRLTRSGIVIQKTLDDNSDNSDGARRFSGSLSGV
ncbi:hypothetical protein SAMN05216334_10862 [Nitrosomonas ureae]|uniref:Uncharacterized protein n=1 Tax=Nitrosomonas ureae TaxID=44577 RepID=A0A1H5UL46_9PROT|nr:hypothetical protein SAMN05216334_10862 [Nitrosomonas ureae]